MNKTIPIIILNWNGLADTLQCIKAVENQTYKEWQVFLIDNNSDNQEAAVLVKEFGKHPQITTITNDKNYGFTEGNNRQLKNLLNNPDYEYIALLNNDAFPQPQWLEELHKAAKQNQSGMVASKMINYFKPDQMDNSGHRMLNTAEVIPIGFEDPIDEHETATENMGACAGACLYSTKMLKDIGVFDSYFATGYEDAEFGVRANVLGYKTVYAPKAVVHHKISQSVSKIRDEEYVLKIQLNIFYTYFKLMPIGILILNIPFLIFKYGMVLLLDIVFFRWQFLRIMTTAIYRSFYSERHHILTARKTFMENHQPISSFKIMKKFEFFLWFDIKRFWKHFIKKEKTDFENIPVQ